MQLSNYVTVLVRAESLLDAQKQTNVGCCDCSGYGLINVLLCKTTNPLAVEIWVLPARRCCVLLSCARIASSMGALFLEAYLGPAVCACSAVNRGPAEFLACTADGTMLYHCCWLAAWVHSADTADVG